MSNAESLPRPSDRWIPWYFVLFFLALFAALGGMVFVAIHGYSGVVTDHAYEKGLAYNKTLAAAAEQESWGWKSALAVVPAGEALKVDFTVKDAKGQGIEGADVKIWFMRPTQNIDQTVTLEPQGKGVYAARFTLPLRGQWEAHITAKAQGRDYQLVERVMAP